MKEKMIMNENKKSSVVKAVLIGLGAVVAFVIANIGAMFVLLRKNVKKMKGNESQNNAVHSIGLGKGAVALSPDTNNAYLSCLNGRLDITFTEAPTHDVNMDLTCICGKVNVTVPASMRVISDLKPCSGKVDVACETPDDENAPALRLTGKTCLGKVVVHK